MNKSEELSDELEEMGNTDRYEKLQLTRPEVDEDLIYYNIEQLWEYEKDYGIKVNQWCQVTLVSLKSGGKVHIKWDDTCLIPDNSTKLEETLLKSKWNKHVHGGWRINLDMI